MQTNPILPQNQKYLPETTPFAKWWSMMKTVDKERKKGTKYENLIKEKIKNRLNLSTTYFILILIYKPIKFQVSKLHF